MSLETPLYNSINIHTYNRSELSKLRNGSESTSVLEFSGYKWYVMFNFQAKVIQSGHPRRHYNFFYRHIVSLKTLPIIFLVSVTTLATKLKVKTAESIPYSHVCKITNTREVQSHNDIHYLIIFKTVTYSSYLTTPNIGDN